MSDLFTQDQPNPKPPSTLPEALLPFLRYAVFIETAYGAHRDDALIAGTSKCGLTFGDFRNLISAIRTDEKMHSPIVRACALNPASEPYAEESGGR
jgi:hypothetical protein